MFVYARRPEFAERGDKGADRRAGVWQDRLRLGVPAMMLGIWGWINLWADVVIRRLVNLEYHFTSAVRR